LGALFNLWWAGFHHRKVPVEGMRWFDGLQKNPKTITPYPEDECCIDEFEPHTIKESENYKTPSELNDSPIPPPPKPKTYPYRRQAKGGKKIKK
jgi:hypothetical protein